MSPDGTDTKRSDAPRDRMALWLAGAPDDQLDTVVAEIAGDSSALSAVSGDERARTDAWLEGDASLE